VSAEIERVREYRRAARVAIRGGQYENRNRYLALIALAEAARAEPDPLVRTWSERAIWEESKGFLGVDDREPEPPGDLYERSQRKLRSRGYAACPTCKSPLASEVDFERWHHERQDRIAEIRRREQAVET
jgi:hypothetical protein